jgi:Zn-dependent protease with chaperone function
MKFSTLLYSLLGTASCLSQTTYSHGFINGKSQAPLVTDYSIYEKAMTAKYDTAFKNKKLMQAFIDEHISALKSRYSTGGIYTNWQYAEDYLNAIAKKLLGSKWTPNISIKIVRDPEVNASMTESGQAYFNTGFLAFASNEAEIAATLGHEYGHYEHLDHYYSFQEAVKNQKHRQISSAFGLAGLAFYFSSTYQTFANSREMERNADRTGIELSKEAGYNLYAALHVEKGLGALEKNWKKSENYRRGLYFRTHPPSEERIAYTAQAAAASDTSQASYFLVDKEVFRIVKKQAIDECINLYLQSNDYESAIELCYRQLLLNPNDEFYLFYLNESLRRFLYEYPGKEEEFFITGSYDTQAFPLTKEELPRAVKSQRYPKLSASKIGKTIFYHYEYLMLTDDQNHLNVSLPPSELTNADTLEFITYREALDYFTARQIALKQGSVSWLENCTVDSLKYVNVQSAEPWLNNYNTIAQDVISCLSPERVDEPIPVLVTGFDYEIDYNYMTKKGVRADSIEQLCLTLVKGKLDKKFRIFDEEKIDINKRLQVLSFFEEFKSYTFEPKNYTDKQKAAFGGKYESVDVEMALLTPEIIGALNKYNLQQLVAVDMNYSDVMDNMYFKSMQTDVMNFNLYYFDVKAGRVAHLYRGVPIGENKTTNAFEEFPNYLQDVMRKPGK